MQILSTVCCGCWRPGIRSFNKTQVMPMGLHVVHEEPGQWLQLPSSLQRPALAQTSVASAAAREPRPPREGQCSQAARTGRARGRARTPRPGEDPRGQARTPEARPGQPHTAVVTSQTAKPVGEGCTVVLCAPCLPVSSGCLNQCLLSGLRRFWFHLISTSQ